MVARWWRSHEIQIVDDIDLLEGSKQPPVARIAMCIGAAEYQSEHELRHQQLGAAFRCSTTVQSLAVGRSGRIEEDNNFDRPVFQSIQALCRGF
eukprot:scaffold14422_cov75-Cyclotella_meneghiniana.AAC.3